MPIKLKAIDGILCVAREDIHDPTVKKYSSEEMALIRRYEEGDVDTCPWPMTKREHRERLQVTLYDARETGVIPSRDNSVILPDGTEFNFL